MECNDQPNVLFYGFDSYFYGSQVAFLLALLVHNYYQGIVLHLCCSRDHAGVVHNDRLLVDHKHY